MPKRSYGTGHLFARADKHGRVVWYGQWRVGQTKVKRTIGPKRQTGSREGLTRTQAERELRRRIEAETFVRPATARRTVLEVGEEYVDHLEHVMDRKATTIKDYRGYLHGHFEPSFGDRPVDRIDEGWVAAYLKQSVAEAFRPRRSTTTSTSCMACSSSPSSGAGLTRIQWR